LGALSVKDPADCKHPTWELIVEPRWVFGTHAWTVAIVMCPDCGVKKADETIRPEGDVVAWFA